MSEEGYKIEKALEKPKLRYEVSLIDTRPGPNSEENNAKILGPNTLGIEVTIPEFASRCGLGNIDPQHTDGNVNLTAIEVASNLELPPEGAKLATIRADLDSLGAMAILDLRKSMNEDPSLFTDEEKETIKNRVNIIADSDKFAHGSWPGVQPLPKIDSLGTEGESRLAAIGASVADYKISVEDRVNWVKDWLAHGKEPEKYRENWVAERTQISKALESGEIKVNVIADGKIAVVESTHRAGTSIGYRLAPVVVAINPSFSFQGGAAHKKFTIGQFDPTRVDLISVKKDLLELESGWGGSPTIIGSPQGKSSELSEETILEVVKKHLL